MGRFLTSSRLARIDGEVVALKANQPGIICEVGDDRFEIESPVGNVQGNQPAVGQFLQVEVDRFSREQMHRNRIRAEGVEDQQPILPFGSFAEP